MRTLRGPLCPAACSPPVPWWAEAWPWSLWSVCSKRRWQETNDQSGDTRPQATWSHSKENGHQGHCRILKRWCECHMPQWPPNTRTCIQQRSYKNIHQVPGVKSRLFKDSICRVLWTQGWCSTRCSVITQRLLVQVQGESPDGADGRLPTPLLVSPCPGSGSGPGWGMYWLYPSP